MHMHIGNVLLMLLVIALYGGLIAEALLTARRAER